MSVIAVIPARYGSTRLPAKALAEIGGVPMIVRVWGQVSLARSVERVIVATDATVEAVAALSDMGKYVAVDVSSMHTTADTADNSNASSNDDDDDDDGTGVRLYQSICGLRWRWTATGICRQRKSRFWPMRLTYSVTTGSWTSFTVLSTCIAYCLPILISVSSEYQFPRPRPPMLRLPMASTSSSPPSCLTLLGSGS